jgi:RNA polymerase sigma-70 factor (ECF subfamily)
MAGKMRPTNRDLPGPSPLPPDEDEVALLHRVASKDRYAFELLYRSYYRRLTRFLEQTTRAPQLIGEILDDTMLVVWEKAATFNGESLASTWIFAIAYKKAMKALKRERRSVAILSDDDALASADSPETEFIERESRLALRRLLAALSVEQRAVIELTYYHGCAYKEIATIIGCPVNTVKTRMFYAHRKLKAILIGRAKESGDDAPLPLR